MILDTNVLSAVMQPQPMAKADGVIIIGLSRPALLRNEGKVGEASCQGGGGVIAPLPPPSPRGWPGARRYMQPMTSCRWFLIPCACSCR